MTETVTSIFSQSLQGATVKNKNNLDSSSTSGLHGESGTTPNFPKIITTVVKLQVESNGSAKVISHWSTIEGVKTVKKQPSIMKINPVIDEEVSL